MYKRERGISVSTFTTFSGLIVVQMSNPETPPKKRKLEPEICDEENSKKSKIECSAAAPLESPGQEIIEDKHLTDETLADTTSEKAKEVDNVQVRWIYNKLLRVRVSTISLDRISFEEYFTGRAPRSIIFGRSNYC